jgi:hypothetical protein
MVKDKVSGVPGSQMFQPDGFVPKAPRQELSNRRQIPMHGFPREPAGLYKVFAEPPFDTRDRIARNRDRRDSADIAQLRKQGQKGILGTVPRTPSAAILKELFDSPLINIFES